MSMSCWQRSNSDTGRFIAKGEIFSPTNILSSPFISGLSSMPPKHTVLPPQVFSQRVTPITITPSIVVTAIPNSHHNSVLPPRFIGTSGVIFDQSILSERFTGTSRAKFDKLFPYELGEDKEFL
jgi:hypothetical protein